MALFPADSPRSIRRAENRAAWLDAQRRARQATTQELRAAIHDLRNVA